jgi:hypothetical protein
MGLRFPELLELDGKSYNLINGVMRPKPLETAEIQLQLTLMTDGGLARGHYLEISNEEYRRIDVLAHFSISRRLDARSMAILAPESGKR